MSFYRKFLEKNTKLDSLQQQSQLYVQEVQIISVGEIGFIYLQKIGVLLTIQLITQCAHSECFQELNKFTQMPKDSILELLYNYELSKEQGFFRGNYETLQNLYQSFLEQLKDQEYKRCNICTCKLKIPQPTFKPINLEKRPDLTSDRMLSRQDKKIKRDHIDVPCKNQGVVLGIMRQIIKGVLFLVDSIIFSLQINQQNL